MEAPPTRDMDTGGDGTMRKRRPLISKSRPISSSNVSSKEADSISSRPLSEAVGDYKGGDRPPDGPVIHSSSSTSSPTMAGSTTSVTDTTGPTSSSSSRSNAIEIASAHKDDAGTSREYQRPTRRRPPRGAQRPNSLHMSESESPTVTQGFIQLSSKDSGQYKARRRGPPISPSVSSSAPSTIPNDVFSERQAESRSDLSWSPEYPEYAVATQIPSQISPGFDPHFGGPHPVPQQYPPLNYGAPETPRGNAPFQYFQPPHYQNPMAAPNPRVPQPRAERPLSGYELVAAKLAGHVGPPVRPMYRRFEAINHRILLSLQDQITTLEDSLEELDEVDAVNRQQAGIPASEREERESNHPFHERKGRILGLLSQKLQAYNTLLASFGHIQGLPPPTMGDVQNYRAFLANEMPIAELETGFLHTPDLVLLEPNPPPPMEHRAPDDLPPPPIGGPEDDPDRPQVAARRHIFNRGPVQDLAIGVVVAIFGPLFTFAVIHDFAGRMTIIILFGVIVSMVLFGSGAFNELTTARDAQETLMYGGVYVGGMTVLARFLQ